MERRLSARLDLHASGPARLVLAVAVSDGHDREESLTVTQAGRECAWSELADSHGGRLHVVDVGEGPVSVAYDALVRGMAAPAAVAPLDEVTYLRPSRYCESDTLGPTAVAQFGGLAGHALVEAVSAWVRGSLAYVSGASSPTDGAAATMLARAGVCRDFAHLVVALLRACDVPARVVAVYAPGLEPMDFHAVAEALVDGEWWVVDATGLAPRSTLVRIATGRDAADTAFLTSIGEGIDLVSMSVSATAQPFTVEDAVDGPGARVRLG